MVTVTSTTNNKIKDVVIPLTPMGLFNALKNSGAIPPDDIPSIEKEIKESGGNEEKILLRHGIRFQDILRAKRADFGIPVMSLEGIDIPHDVLQLISEDSSLYYRIIPIGIRESALLVGIVQPQNIEAREAAQFASQKAGM